MRVDKSKWQKIFLGEVCNLYQPKTIATSCLDSNGKYLVYGANGVIGKYNEYNHKFPEVLITCRGATCGTINISKPFSWINGNAMVVHPKEENLLDFAFLGKAVSAIDYSKVITGAAQPQITRANLQKVQIVIPTLVEQQTIASELDAVQEMIDGYKAQIADLDALAQSIFLDMFGDPVTNPKGWEIMKIGEISEVTSSKRIYQSEQTKSGIPFYKISDFPNLIEYGYSDTGIFISQAKYEELKSQKLVPNESDLLITSRGTLGLCYIVKDEDCFYFQDGMITWLKNLKSTVLSAFLGFMFQSYLFKNQIEKAQNGSTIAYLSIAMIRKFDMIVPPIKLQQHFVSQVEAIEKQKELIRQQLTDAETLMAERMQYYFS